MLLMAQQELIGVGGFPPLKRLFLPSCCLETNYKENPGVCCHICGIDQSAGIKRAPSHTDDDHELNLTPLMGEYWGGVQHYRRSSLWVSCSGMFSCTPVPLFPRNVYNLSTFPGVFKGELVFTQKRAGEGALNVMRTRAVVVIFEWVTSFFADSCEGLLGGRPWISHTLFQTVRRKFLVCSRIHLMRNWRHLWIFNIMALGISSNLWVRTRWVITESLEMRRLSRLCVTARITRSICPTCSKIPL